ncbi:MAG: 2-phospho-L-lactate transferase CofD family protein, partial [Actinomycetes bacterium]
PSNPVVSIGPLLALPAVQSAIEARRERVVAISPIIGGAALKGPADRMLRELGFESNVRGIARWYQPFVRTLVIDEADRASADDVRNEGVDVVVTDTVMSRPGVGASLARAALDAAGVVR